MATEKGTIHVFATNPYGGPADEQSHLTGRVVNPKEVVCDFSFRVLLYCVSLTASSSSRCRPNCMLSFAFECRSLRHRRWYQYRWHSLFFRSLCSCRPPCFLCAFSPARFQQQLDRLTDVLSSSNHSYQDVLLFNPREGSLSLRRVILSKQARDRLSSGLSAVPLPGGTSISLPGVNTFGRLGTSAPAEGSHVPSGLSRMMARSSEVGATESIVATWMLKRAKDWKELKRPLRPPSRKRLNRAAKPE